MHILFLRNQSAISVMQNNFSEKEFKKLYKTMKESISSNAADLFYWKGSWRALGHLRQIKGIWVLRHSKGIWILRHSSHSVTRSTLFRRLVCRRCSISSFFWGSASQKFSETNCLLSGRSRINQGIGQQNLLPFQGSLI